MNTTAAIYTRYSPGEDREKTSTTINQVRMCREHAQKNGWIVSEEHIYSDEYISGGSDERPAFQKMLSDIDEGNFPDILIPKIPRVLRGMNFKQGSTRNGSDAKASRFGLCCKILGMVTKAGSQSDRWISL